MKTGNFRHNLLKYIFADKTKHICIPIYYIYYICKIYVIKNQNKQL